MLCYRCGTHVPDTAETCSSCGTKLAFSGRPVGGAAPKRVKRAIDGAPLAVGEVLANRYEITGSIGAGPVGWVFRGKDTEIDVPVAVKVLTSRLLQTPDERKEFSVAMRGVRKLAHRNIVRLYDEGEDGERPFFTMQQIEGASLRKVIEMRKEKGVLFSLREVQPLFDQLAEALDHAHQSLAHGDLKPENVLITPEMLKVTDFGLAQVLPRQPFVAAQKQAGGHRYLAPEVVAGEKIEPASDVYALGVIFAEMMGGWVYDPATPFDLCALNPALPRSADALFQRAVNPRPASRFPSAGAFAKELHAVLAEAGEKAGVVSARPPPPPEPEEVEDDAVEELEGPRPSIHDQVTREAPAYDPSIHDQATREMRLADVLGSQEEAKKEEPPSPVKKNVHEAQTAQMMTSPIEVRPEAEPPAGQPRAESRPDVHEMQTAQMKSPFFEDEKSARPPSLHEPVKPAPRSKPDLHDLPTSQMKSPFAEPPPPALRPPAEVTGPVGLPPTPVSHGPRRTPPGTSPAASGRPPQRSATKASRAPVYAAVAGVALVVIVLGAYRWHQSVLEAATREAKLKALEEAATQAPPVVAPPIVAPPPKAEPPPVVPAAAVAEPPRKQAGDAAAEERRREREELRAQAESERLAREAARKKEEEKRLAVEEAARKKEEEKRLAVEEAARKKEEEKRLAVEEAARKKEEEKRLAAEEAARKREEEARARSAGSMVAAAATGAEEKKCPAGMKWIPPGVFTIGSAADDPMRNFGERNQAKVDVGGFCMDLYEYPNKPKSAPRVNVSFATAKANCEKLGKRLCTEEEWEKACKGPGGTRFPYGNDFDANACNTEDADGNDRAVALAGQFDRCRSGYGIFDMAGNVAEWTSTEFAPDSGERTIKGGAANRPDWDTRCATRGSKAPGVQNPFLGFRCCWSP